MYDACVFVTIEVPGEPVCIRLWTGPTYQSIRKGARKAYGSDATLLFGKLFHRAW